MTLKLEISREVAPIEVVNLVWGTGALTWPWWQGASLRRSVPGERSIGVPSDAGDYTDTVQETDWFRFIIDDPDEPEGSGKTLRRDVRLGTIVAAASALLRGVEQANGAILRLDSEDTADMRIEDLGYADAAIADTILQWAVFGKVVYG